MTLLGDATEQALRAQLEPDACCALPYTDGTLYAASMAVSAKRQADALTAIAGVFTGGGDNAALHGMISSLMWEAGRSFQAGTRTDR